jgi:hypothetical protein
MSTIKSIATITPTVLSPKIEDYVCKYRLCVKKTAANILELADVVNSACRDLSKSDFNLFRNAIGADKSKDSYIKKLKVIGGKIARLNEISDKLPPNYTTLYALSQLDDDTFTQVLHDDLITPAMTAFTLASYAYKKSMKNIPRIILSFKNLSVTDQSIAFTEIQSVCNKFNIDFKSNIQFTLTNKMPMLNHSTMTLIEDIKVKNHLETV